MIETSNGTNSNQDDSLDLRKYLYLIVGNWYWFFFSLIICLVLVTFVNRYTKPVYQVSSSLYMKDDASRGNAGLESVIPGMSILRTQQKVMNEMEVLRSFSLTSRAIKELDFDVAYIGMGRSGFKVVNLYHQSPYIVIPDTARTNIPGLSVFIDFISKDSYTISLHEKNKVIRTLRFGEKYESAQLNFTIILRDSAVFNPWNVYYTNYFYFNNPSALVNQYRAKLRIRVNDEKRGSVLFLSTSGNSSEQEANYLNKLMQVYIRQGLEEKNETAVNTVNFIDEQLGVLTDSLQHAEMNLQNFRLSNKLFDIASEGTMAYSRSEKLYEERALLQLQSRYFDYLKEYIQKKNNTKEIIVPALLNIGEPVLTGIIEQLNKFFSRKEELKYLVQTSSTQMMQLDEQIELLRKALQENLDNVIHNQSIAIRENDKQINNVDREFSQLPITQRLLINIQRQYKVNDQIYTFLLQKRAESAIAMASNVSDNRVLDYANPRNALKTAPKTSSNNMLGLLFGLLIPFSFLLLIELLNDKISSRNDIEKRSRVPIIGSVGHYLGTSDIPVKENPRSSLSETFRGLRTNLYYLMVNKEQKVISITSTISGEGKTFTSINLATVFAMAGKKTLLIGLDMRKPKFKKIFGIDDESGMSTFLINRNSFEEIVRPAFIENLYVIGAGPIPPNPAELIDSKAMARCIALAREQFDIIIIDTPPFGLVTDALLAGRMADVNLFVLRQMYSTYDVLEPINALYVKNELSHMGIVLNDVRLRGYYYNRGYRYYSFGYGYGYSYGYRSRSKTGYYTDDFIEKVSLGRRVINRLLGRKEAKK